MISKNIYEVHIETVSGQSYGDTFGFKPEIRHLKESLARTIKALQEESRDESSDELYRERADIEAARLDNVEQFLGILRPIDLDAAYDKTREVMVAGVRIGDIEIETKPVLFEGEPNVVSARPFTISDPGDPGHHGCGELPTVIKPSGYRIDGLGE